MAHLNDYKSFKRLHKMALYKMTPYMIPQTSGSQTNYKSFKLLNKNVL